MDRGCLGEYTVEVEKTGANTLWQTEHMPSLRLRLIVAISLPTLGVWAAE